MVRPALEELLSWGNIIARTHGQHTLLPHGAIELSHLLCYLFTGLWQSAARRCRMDGTCNSCHIHILYDRVEPAAESLLKSYITRDLIGKSCSDFKTPDQSSGPQTLNFSDAKILQNPPLEISAGPCSHRGFCRSRTSAAKARSREHVLIVSHGT